MSPGRTLRWRLLSPLVVLLWIAFTVGLAGAAQADDLTGPAHLPAPAGHARSDVMPSPDTVGASSHRPTNPNSSSQSSSHASDASSNAADAHPTRAARTGQLTSPQPISNADASGGGANGQCPGGPYCSTRDGLASHNGSGGGLATGKPCAGCVGKADNKNPQGQMPDASDHNAGYECDTNHGIARSNPAHTACASGPEQGCVPSETTPCVPPECVPSETTPCVPPECVPSETNPCVSPPQCVPSATVPCIPGSTVVEAPLPPQAAAAPAAVVSPAARALPNTGTPEDLAWLAGSAVVAIAAGIALLARRRRPAGS